MGPIFEYIYIPKLGPGIFFFLLAFLYQPYLIPGCILTAYIISPLHGKVLSSSNSSVLFLRSSSMMHCGLRFKYHNFSRLVVSLTQFGQVTVMFRPSHLPWWWSILYPIFYTPLPWQSRVSFHNLASRVRAIVCSEDDILMVMARAKRIYILIIKVDRFSFFRNEIFLASYRNSRESLGELAKSKETAIACRVPAAFFVLPNIQGFN